MKIGEFAKACNVPISVIRYYDSFGLLKPIYIDRFTGYRYYSENQISVCKHISELKSAGFSLVEIKLLISGSLSEAEINDMFEQKKQRLNEILRQLDNLRNITGGTFMTNEEFEIMHENLDIPFENDAKAVGRWEILGEYANLTDFELGNKISDGNIGNRKREVFFLPNGEKYWCYSWSKGSFMIDDGVSTYINAYTTEKQSDGLYMFVKMKSYDYLQSGLTTLLVLRQLDNLHYKASEIVRKDNIDMPFVNDITVLGKWKSVAYIEQKEDFSPENEMSPSSLYFKEIEFLLNGECISIYGNETISGTDMQQWTKGYILRKRNSSACAYEIINIGGTEYLFTEWKSGDYRWGGFDTDYYVFKRA